MTALLRLALLLRSAKVKEWATKGTESVLFVSSLLEILGSVGRSLEDLCNNGPCGWLLAVSRLVRIC